MNLSITKRTSAFFALFFFLFTNSIPPGFAQLHSPFSEKIPHPYLELNLPQEIGRVEESHLPNVTEPVAPFVFHLQTAHGDIDSQKKVKEILRFLRDSSGVRLIFAEGAGEKLDPGLLHFFPDRASNSKMADLLLEKGLYTGVDLFLLDDQGRKVEILGVEKPRLYRAAYQNFKKVFLNSRRTDFLLGEIRFRLNREASKTLSKDLLELVKNWLGFQENRKNLLTYANFLIDRAKRSLQLDFHDPFSQLEWPQLVRIAKLQEFEKPLDHEKLEEEKKKIFTSQIPFPRPIDLEKHPRLAFERFLQKALPLGFRFEDDPDSTRWMASLILRSELDGRALTQELDRLWKLLLEHGTRSEKERELVGRYEELVLLRRLLHLELTREEWGKLKGEGQNFHNLQGANRGGFVQNLPRSGEGNRRPRGGLRPGPQSDSFQEIYMSRRGKTLPPFPPKNWRAVGFPTPPRKISIDLESDSARGRDLPGGTTEVSSPERGLVFAKAGATERRKAWGNSALRSALHFYRLVERRESVFLETLTREMKSRKMTKAVLVTGGFHTSGLTKLFKEKGIGYAVISPRMDERVDTDLYRKTMLDLAQLEEIEFPQGPVKKIMGRDLNKENRLVYSSFKSVMAEIRPEEQKKLWRATPYMRKSVNLLARAEVRAFSEIVFDGLGSERIIFHAKGLSHIQITIRRTGFGEFEYGTNYSKEPQKASVKKGDLTVVLDGEEFGLPHEEWHVIVSRFERGGIHLIRVPKENSSLNFDWAEEEDLRRIVSHQLSGFSGLLDEIHTFRQSTVKGTLLEGLSNLLEGDLFGDFRIPYSELGIHREEEKRQERQNEYTELLDSIIQEVNEWEGHLEVSLRPHLKNIENQDRDKLLRTTQYLVNETRRMERYLDSLRLTDGWMQKFLAVQQDSKADMRNWEPPIFVNKLRQHRDRAFSLRVLRHLGYRFELYEIPEKKLQERLRQDPELGRFIENFARFLKDYGNKYGDLPAEASNALLEEILQKLSKTDAFYEWERTGRESSPRFGGVYPLLREFLAQPSRAEVRKKNLSLPEFLEKSFRHPRSDQRQVADSLASGDSFQADDLGLRQPHRDQFSTWLGKFQSGWLKFGQELSRVVSRPEFRFFLKRLEFWYLGPFSLGHGLFSPRIKPSFSIRHIPGRDRADRTLAEVTGYHEQIPSVVGLSIDQIKPPSAFKNQRSMITSLFHLFGVNAMAPNMTDRFFKPFEMRDLSQFTSPIAGVYVYIQKMSTPSRAEVRSGASVAEQWLELITRDLDGHNDSESAWTQTLSDAIGYLLWSGTPSPYFTPWSAQALRAPYDLSQTELVEIGQGIRDYWHGRGWPVSDLHYKIIFHPRLGSGTDAKGYLWREKRKILLEQGNLEEKLLRDWMNGVLQVSNLRWAGFHMEEHGQRPVDNELHIDSVRRFISLFLAWRKSSHPELAPANLRYQRGPIPVKYDDLMLWGLAVMLDPTVHDWEIRSQSYDTKNDQLGAREIWKGGGRESVSEYLRWMLADLKEVEELLAEAISRSPENWRQLGFRPSSELSVASLQEYEDPLKQEAVSQPLYPLVLNLALSSSKVLDPWANRKYGRWSDAKVQFHSLYYDYELAEKDVFLNWPVIREILPNLHHRLAGKMGQQEIERVRQYAERKDFLELLRLLNRNLWIIQGWYSPDGVHRYRYEDKIALRFIRFKGEQPDPPVIFNASGKEFSEFKRIAGDIMNDRIQIGKIGDMRTHHPGDEERCENSRPGLGFPSPPAPRCGKKRREKMELVGPFFPMFNPIHKPAHQEKEAKKNHRNL